MREEDAAAVLVLELETSDFPWNENLFRDCVRVGYSCWVVMEGQAIVGFGLLSITAGEAHVLNFVIKPSHQGQGLGKKLMQHLLDVACQLKAETIYLEVRPSNLRAIQLYYQFNFSQVGRRTGYYQAPNNQREDALVMARGLDNFNAKERGIL
jgi:ribosomal-protein-alanine N-acetyltransferase